MSWRDFFYFSKGERRGLIVLLCLITIAGILLIWNNRPLLVRNMAPEQTSVGSPIDGHILSEDKSANAQASDHQSASKQISASSSSEQSTSLKQTTSSATGTSVKNVSSSTEASDKKAFDVNIPITSDVEPDTDAEKESVSERVKRLTSYSRPSYPRVEKFEAGTVVELNTADTTVLKKVPGIGSSFAKRIIGYRNLLGGYYSVTQLSEVYGIDEDKYKALVPWFSANPSLVSRLAVNRLSQDSLRRHPYINYGQAKVIVQLRKQKGKLTGWDNLLLLDEFTDGDKMRLQPYLSFE